jgi:hypothetical protein
VRLLISTLLIAGCAEDLSKRLRGQTEPELAAVVTEAQGGGVFVTTVDAADGGAWVYFAFATGAEVELTDAHASSTWDLGFQRFKITSNGGVSGSGGAGVLAVEATAFEALERAPVGEYAVDLADGDDANTDPDLAFDNGVAWYDYDASTHVLSPRDVVFVVRGSEARYFKTEIQSYYDTAGSAGHLAFRWAELLPPE